MAGHSKWAKIKRKKAANDAKKGQLFTKLLREIQVAARLGGNNPDSNFRLRSAIVAAKSMGVPNANIEKAIQRGDKSSEEDLQEITYEGYGPGGVAILVEALSDNRNRTASEVRHVFSKYGGTLGSSNCVSYLFQRKDFVIVPKKLCDNDDELLDVVLKVVEDIDDILDTDDAFEISVDSKDLFKVRDAIIKHFKVEDESEVLCERRLVPTTTVQVSGENIEGLEKLLNALDDLDDVQNVFCNAEIGG